MFSKLTSKTINRLILVATATTAACAGGAASADESGAPFRLNFGTHPRLLPALYAREVAPFADEGITYAYVARGYFKVRGDTVARLRSFAGTADSVADRVRLPISHDSRHAIRKAASRSHTRTVMLTLVYSLTPLTLGTAQTVKQYVYLTIPRT